MSPVDADVVSELCEQSLDTGMPVRVDVKEHARGPRRIPGIVRGRGDIVDPVTEIRPQLFRADQT